MRIDEDVLLYIHRAPWFVLVGDEIDIAWKRTPPQQVLESAVFHGSLDNKQTPFLATIYYKKQLLKTEKTKGKSEKNTFKLPNFKNLLFIDFLNYLQIFRLIN